MKAIDQIAKIGEGYRLLIDTINANQRVQEELSKELLDKVLAHAEKNQDVVLIELIIDIATRQQIANKVHGGVLERLLANAKKTLGMV